MPTTASNIKSVPHTLEQNGIAVRDHQSTVEAARSHTKGAPLKLWAAGVNHSVYVLNRKLIKNRNVTPYALWHGTAPDISNIRVFGSSTYFLGPDSERKKFDPKATSSSSPRVYVGESKSQKASRIYVEAPGRTHVTRHVKAYENLQYWNEPPPVDFQTETNSNDTLKLSISSVVIPEKQKESKMKATTLPLPTRKSARGLIPRKI